MPTWGALDTLALEYAHDPYGLTHSAETARGYLEAAELFICLARGLAEETGNLSITTGTPVYTIHSTLSDFIIPLRVTINGVIVNRTSLNAVQQKHPRWWVSHTHAQATDPWSWFPIGGTLIGFYPVPDSNETAVFTYLRVPPTGQADGNSPVIPDEWHYLMPHYAAAMLFAIEGEMVFAAEEMAAFLEGLGDARSVRFLPNAKQRGVAATDVVVKQSED